MRKHLATILVAALTALAVVASLNVTPAANATLVANQASYRRTGNNPFTSGASLTHTDLNANFDALVTVIDGNIDATNIANSIEALWPRAWAKATGSAAPSCTINDHQGVTSCTRNGAGEYTVTLTTARANTTFAAICSAGTTVADETCHCEPATASTVLVRCFVSTTGTETDTVFNMVIFDS